MSKRKWTNIRAVESEIISMYLAGKTRQEIADELGLKKGQIKAWVNRYNREQKRLEAGLPPKRRGRPRKSEYKGAKFFAVSRSGYYAFVKRLGQKEHDAEIVKEIQKCQNSTDKRYGYRRVWKGLKDRNIRWNPKAILRIMKKYGLLSEIRRRRKWINLGQQVHRYENLLNRQFKAVKPNTKWVTDISYIHTKAGVLIYDSRFV